MTLVHLHLILNHVPVLGVAFGFALLVWALVRKNRELFRVVCGAYAILALLTVPAYFTGEPAEQAVANLPGVTTNVIERHEGAAATAFAGIAVLGVASLLGLLLSRRGREIPAWMRPALLILAIGVCGLMFWTATLGGQIRHTEIRSSTQAAPAAMDEDD